MKKVMAKSGVKKAQNGMSTKTAKAKPMAKKASAKMAMKKPAVKKAQDGLNIDSKTMGAIKSLQAQRMKEFEKGTRSMPANEANRIQDEKRRQRMEDDRKRAISSVAGKSKEELLKDLKEIKPNKQKNGGKIKR